MRITVDVKPNSREDCVELFAENHYVVRVKAPASKGKANAAVMKLLRKHLGRHVSLVSGYTSSRKIFVLEE